MRNIGTYISEKLKINKDDGISYNYHPKDRDELRQLIQKLLKERGWDADLNDIDTSEITDMHHLFYGLNIHNIDISKWNVSNVKDMWMMFYGCVKFDCDLSAWNTTGCKIKAGMFIKCHSLKKIPDWYTE